MQGGIYHQLFMFFTLSPSVSSSHSPPQHTHAHTNTHLSLHTWLCTSAQPSDVLGGAADAHTIAFSVRLAQENGSFRHFRVCFLV